MTIRLLHLVLSTSHCLFVRAIALATVEAMFRVCCMAAKQGMSVLYGCQAGGEWAAEIPSAIPEVSVVCHLCGFRGCVWALQ